MAASGKLYGINDSDRPQTSLEASSDGGKTWQGLTQISDPVQILAADPARAGRVLAGTVTGALLPMAGSKRAPTAADTGRLSIPPSFLPVALFNGTLALGSSG